MSLFGDLADAIRDAFSGGTAAGGTTGGSDRAPSRSQRPQTRPSIMTVQREGEDRQRVATRDIPQFGITAGQTTTEPEYGAASLRGLTSTDPANVMRNIQGAERAARMAPAGGGEDRPEAAKGERPAEAAAPEPDVGEAKGARPTEEGTGESAAARARRLGLASTIATTPGGLLAGEGATRQRRSLMGGGLIR